jgi:hypothetical protein
MATSFIEKLQAFRNVRQTDIGLFLAPRLSIMPLPIQRYDDPFFPFGWAIIDAPRDLVCMYMFDLGSYLMPGAASAIALERTIAYVASDAWTILHDHSLGRTLQMLRMKVPLLLTLSPWLTSNTLRHI